MPFSRTSEKPQLVSTEASARPQGSSLEETNETLLRVRGRVLALVRLDLLNFVQWVATYSVAGCGAPSAAAHLVSQAASSGRHGGITDPMRLCSSVTAPTSGRCRRHAQAPAGHPNARKLKRYQPIVSDINLLEEEIAPL